MAIINSSFKKNGDEYTSIGYILLTSDKNYLIVFFPEDAAANTRDAVHNLPKYITFLTMDEDVTVAKNEESSALDRIITKRIMGPTTRNYSDSFQGIIRDFLKENNNIVLLNKYLNFIDDPNNQGKYYNYETFLNDQLSLPSKKKEAPTSYFPFGKQKVSPSGPFGDNFPEQSHQKNKPSQRTRIVQNNEGSWVSQDSETGKKKKEKKK